MDLLNNEIECLNLQKSAVGVSTTFSPFSFLHHGCRLFFATCGGRFFVFLRIDLYRSAGVMGEHGQMVAVVPTSRLIV